MKRMRGQTRFALCVRTDGSEDLEQRKVYQILPDRAASRDGYVRVIDESGEDYLYPAKYFVPVSLPAAVVHNLESANLAQGPANTALQPTGGARHLPRKSEVARRPRLSARR
jgi:hypothetical protein